MNEKLVSIIIPVYNVEKYLERCLESIIHQTYRHLEIILIDDGSSDNSGKICDEYANKDERIKAIHQKNGGASAARNTGVAAATGDYIAFIDADDYITEDYIDYLYNLIIENNADISSCGYEQVSGQPVAKSSASNIKVLSGYDAAMDFIRGKLLNVVMLKLIKADIAKRVIFPNGHINEDVSTGYLYFYYSCKAVISDVKKYGYFSNPNGVTNTNHIKGKRKDDYIYNLKIRGEFLEKNKEKKLSKISNSVLARYLMTDSAKYDGRSDKEIKELFSKKLFSGYIAVNSKLLYLTYKISPKLYLKCKKYI